MIKKKKKVLSEEVNANTLFSKNADPQNQHELNFAVLTSCPSKNKAY